MITIILSWVLVFLYAKKLKINRTRAFWFVIFSTTFLVYLSLAEVLLVSPEDIYSRLDESYFLRIAGLSFNEILAEGSRYRLFHLYNYLTYNTLFGWHLSLKIHLVAFSMLIMLVLYDSTRNIYAIWLFTIVFSYIIFLSTLNMRDVILIFMTLYSLLGLVRARRQRTIFWIVLPSLLLLLIRPQAAFFYLLASIWIGVFAKKTKTPFVAYFVPAGIIIGVIVLNQFFQQAIVYLQLYTPFNPEPYLQERSGEITRIPFLGENVNALVRQIITPLPTSKLGEILAGGMSANFYLYEISRSVMMLSVYMLIGYLMLHWRYLGNAFKHNKFLGALLIMAVLYTAAYAIFSDGGGDSRNKLYPFFLFYVLFLQISLTKTEICRKDRLTRHSSIGVPRI